MKRILLFFLFGTSLLSALAQISTVEQYADITGNNTIIRRGTNCFVTAYAGDHDCAGFIVESGGSTMNFVTSTYNLSTLTNKGYHINDIEIIDRRCWFCGSQWEETGNMIYLPFGNLSYPEVLHEGIVGYFDVDDVMNGSGNFFTILIDSTKKVTRVAACVSDASFIAVTEDDTTILVNLGMNLVGGPTVSHYRSQILSERFMDIAVGDGKTVILSRFWNHSLGNYNNYYFGLRYGWNNLSHFQTDSIYLYDTYYPFNGPDARFTGLNPIRLDYAQSCGGFVVSFIATYESAIFQNSRKGSLIMYHIASKGQRPTDVLWNRDSQKYKRIKDAGFNKPLVATSNMAILLEDSNGNSVVRFPYMNRGFAFINDTTLTMSSPIIESIAPFQYMSNGFDMNATGYYPTASKKLATINENDIHVGFFLWSLVNCFSLQNSMMQSVESYDEDPNVLIEFNPLLFKKEYKRNFTSHSYTSTTVTKTTTCNNGTNY